ncbi:hypothetical protein B566_EDAN001178 [Ephemera danica]|nr:hypothetical protein B566_EDAN001178 [Ephemera danica]
MEHRQAANFENSLFNNDLQLHGSIEVSNMFIMSLAAADLTVGGIVMPISSVYAITGHWVLGLAVCQFWLSADYTASTASIFNLFILSVDRYWSITSPLRYLRKRTKKRALIMIGLVWLVSALWIVPIISWHHIESSGRRMYPPTVCETEFAGNVVFKVTAAIFNFYFPTLLMVYLYGRIFFEIKKRSRFEIGQCNHSRLGSGDNNEDSLADERASHWTVSQALQREQSSRRSRRNVERASVLSMREWNRGGGTQTAASTSTTSTTRNNNSNGEVRQLHQFRNLTVLSYREEGALLSDRRAARNDALTHFEGVTVNVEYVLGASNESHSNNAGSARGRVPATTAHNNNNTSSTGSSTRPTTQRRSPGLTVRRRAATDSIVLQKEKKAARQLGVIMGAFVLCWLPYFVLFMVIAFCGNCVDPKFHTATIWLGYVNSTLNPILYPLCNANFKRAFKRMLGLGRRTGGNNPTGFTRKAGGGYNN